MTMKKLGIILFGLSVLVAKPVAGQNMYPFYLDQPEVRYQYNSPGIFKGASWGGIYVGPHQGTLLAIGPNPTVAALSLYCVDFYHFTIPNRVITAQVSHLGGAAPSTFEARLGETGLESYKKAAFLASMFDTYASIGQFAGLSQVQAWSGIQAAMWYYTSGPAGSYMADPYLGDFSAYAEANYLGYGAFNEWSVLSTRAVSNLTWWDSQEFLVRTPGLAVEAVDIGGGIPTVTPEPQTYILLFFGLIFLAFAGRRRLREMGYA